MGPKAWVSGGKAAPGNEAVEALRALFQSRGWQAYEAVIAKEVEKRRQRYEEVFINGRGQATGYDVGVTMGLRYAIENVKSGLLAMIREWDEAQQAKRRPAEPKDVL